ncbi:hypothetical protein X777_03585 [Ooceraea biroi]|uniref:Uncharacterized protein n=1 Tax=Ooceraea biroi TaxID=2015173 RepID=A0A026WLZ6_OOCBI|nr:hypothetical protein X777_03585 [Ooceraea biroi]
MNPYVEHVAEDGESRKAKRSRPAGRQAGRRVAARVRRERIGGGRVMGESVRGVARWYGNERFRGLWVDRRGKRGGRGSAGGSTVLVAVAGGRAREDRASE